jgi:hypothetical protein
VLCRQWRLPFVVACSVSKVQKTSTPLEFCVYSCIIGSVAQKIIAVVTDDCSFLGRIDSMDRVASD